MGRRRANRKPKRKKVCCCAGCVISDALKRSKISVGDAFPHLASITARKAYELEIDLPEFLAGMEETYIEQARMAVAPGPDEATKAKHASNVGRMQVSPYAEALEDAGRQSPGQKNLGETLPEGLEEVL